MTASRRGLGLVIPIGLVWWLSHYIFKWIHKKYHSETTLTLCIVGCIMVSSTLLILGVLLGRNASLEIRSLGASSGGAPIDINMLWFGFVLLSLGVWAGFLSGYVKMRAW